MWWGYSEAVDIQDELESAREKEIPGGETSDEVNILLIGHGDARHILKTLSKSYKHPVKQLNFYVVEPTLELYARQMLFISLALEPPEMLGLLEKTRIFMELYGNSLLRPNTAAYLTRKAAQLVEVVTKLGNAISFILLDRLKYKERDFLENVFEFWKNSSRMFDIVKLWDERIRKSLGVRYDSRLGAFDWDYHMRLHPLGGAVINKQEYMHFRQCGVAFTWLETEYSKPNPTLASGILKVGGRFIHHGYIGDTTMGPYATYGLDCEDVEMLKSTQGVYLKRSTDITERNIMRMMSEMERKEEYVHKKTDFDEENLGVVITEICDNVADLVEEGDDGGEGVKADERELKVIDPGRFSVTFLPTGALREEAVKVKYKGMFDVVSVAQYMEGRVDRAVLEMGKHNSLLLVEGKLFVLGLRKEELVTGGKEMRERMEGLGVKGGEFDPAKDRIARFQIVHNTNTEASSLN